MKQTTIARFGSAVLAAALTLTGAMGAPAARADSEQWRFYGRDATEQRFSPLTQIDAKTIDNLGLAWSLDLPFEARSLEATPLMVDGVLYFTASMSVVWAVDALTGKELWRYDPEAWKHNARGMRAGQEVNRGVAYADGAVIVGALDGRLVSLDAKTGKPNWIVDTVEEKDSRKQSTGAPRVFRDKVIIGHTGADYGTRGYVTAYYLKTGKRAWRFYTVPGDPKKGFEDETQAMAAKTWAGEWYRWGGGGTVWNGITFDEELNRIYIGTGNSANYNAAQRSPGNGDNLFLASIVALDADTGKYVWHYQVNPREAWDYKATADIVLADLTIAGKPRKVLMQAPTNGFFYVIDRESGKLISAEKIGKVTWAERIDLATGRPVEIPNVRYDNGPVTFWPSPWGIHNWQAMSFNPQLGLAYIPTMKLGATYQKSEEDIRKAAMFKVGTPRFQFPIGASFSIPVIDPDDATGGLLAWDPVAQKARWNIHLKTPWNGGTLATAANLVFQGTADGWLRGYDGANGTMLWQFYAWNGFISPPISYELNGEQYVTILAGYGGATPPQFDPGWRFRKHVPRVLAFKLGGTAQLPPSQGPDFSVNALDDPSWEIDTAAAARGKYNWDHTCMTCHGPDGKPNGFPAPDLRASPLAHDYDSLKRIVQGGALVSRGMPKYNELGDDEIRELLMHIRTLSRNAAKQAAAAASGEQEVRRREL